LSRPLAGLRSGLQVVGDLESRELGTSRDILVHLPSSYARGARRYPVIYMQDGQNLFDPATSYAGDWKLGRVLATAERRGLEVIAVGIPNAGEQRIDEYSPFVYPARGGGQGETYLRFLIATVKPAIDARFRTLPERSHTGIAGSSMGGLISLYAAFREPPVFGFAAVQSPSLWFAGEAIFPRVEAATVRPDRLYLDIGTEEGLVHVARLRRMREVLVTKGFRPGGDLRYLESRGGRHDEASWSRRFARALPFLLPPS
jgi:predicted alpha/beta superfamily hydrolase